MTLLPEHAAKAILRRYGIPLPAGRLCSSAAEAADAAGELGGAVYVKAQVLMGDRLEAGAVRRAADPREAEAAAAAMLAAGALPVGPVDKLLVEREVAAQRSGYLAVQIRDDGPARFLVFSPEGGSGFDPMTAPVVMPLPIEGLEAYELRDALAPVVAPGRELLDASRLAHAAIRCALDWQLYTLELNPVQFGPDGPVAVDAKMEVDDAARTMLPDPELVFDLGESDREGLARRRQQEDHRGSLRYVQLVAPDGAARSGPLVGTHSVGGGESLVVLDALDEAGVTAANYCDTSGAPSREKVAFAAELVAGQPHIDCLFFSSCIANQPLSVTARGMVDGLKRVSWDRPAVMRLAGNEEAEAISILREWAAGLRAPIEIYGREIDEWTAAQRVAALLREEDEWRS